MEARKLSTGVRAGTRSFLREPLNVVLLVVLPLVAIEVYGQAMASFPQMPFMEATAATTGRISGALFATAFLAGLLGLFQVISAREADRRLLVCGFSRPTLLASRLVTILAVVAVVAGLAAVALTASVQTARPLVAFGVLAAAGVTYSLVGVLMGSLVPRELEGSLVLVFLADVDDFLSSGMLDADVALAKAFPLYHPHHLLRSAVLDGSVSADHALWTGVYVATLLVLALVAYLRATGGVAGGATSSTGGSDR
ncbi:MULTISPECIES: hypothetical protein [Halorussus]|uniref:hypothetical protein n=1 Tax=Halorussus TaxID=1070314 RepID=UPI0020A0B671|nr:hypothetical protein [Halorussus vallis]USZ76316.1 hypothetical protein NGM07_03070 [Halorussus vallis]